MKTILGEYRIKCGKQPLGTKEHALCIKHVAESIILQSIEDLWDKASRRESINFFGKRGFSTCATIAGINIVEQISLLDFVNSTLCSFRSISHVVSPYKNKDRSHFSTLQ